MKAISAGRVDGYSVWRKNVLPDTKQIVLGPVPDLIIQQLISESNIDLTDYVFVIDRYSVRHIMKSHGNAEKEKMRGQRAVTASDFELTYQIVTEPDVVFYNGKNRIGRDVLQFQKRIGEHYII